MLAARSPLVETASGFASTEARPPVGAERFGSVRTPYLPITYGFTDENILIFGLRSVLIVEAFGPTFLIDII